MRPGIDEAAARVVATAGDVDEAARLVELLDRRPQPESLLDLSGYAVKGDDDYEQARQALEQAALNAVAARDRALLERLLQSFEHSYQAAKDRESALDFEDLQLRARNLLRDDAADPRARAAPLPPGLRRRVPGHEPAAVRADRPDRARRAVLRRGRVPVDLPLPPCRRGGVQGAARADRRGAAADPELAVAAGGARGRQRAVRRDVRGRVPEARRGGPLPRSGLGRRRRAARHRQGELQGHGRHLAARRGEGCRPPGAGARRRRRGRAGRDRPALRRRHGCRAVRGGAARARPADLPRDRAGLLRPAAGASTCSATCGSCTTATTTRRSSPCSPRRSSASRTTRSSSCAGMRPAGRCTRRSRRACRRACPSATGVCSRPFASGTTG